MDQETFGKFSLLVVGAILGVISTLAKSIIDTYLNRAEETRKRKILFENQNLEPLRLYARELSDKLFHIVDELRKTKKSPEDYYIGDWFQRCKEYIVNTDENWTDDQRRRELAMHSGGVGYDAVSTLYATAVYLFYATKIRTSPIEEDIEKYGEELRHEIDIVRGRFADIEFYNVTQDTTGFSMSSQSGRVLTYREFCEVITDKNTRPWFMTLSDVFFKLRQSPERLLPTAKSLRELADLSKRERPALHRPVSWISFRTSRSSHPI